MNPLGLHHSQAPSDLLQPMKLHCVLVYYSIPIERPVELWPAVLKCEVGCLLTPIQVVYIEMSQTPDWKRKAWMCV